MVEEESLKPQPVQRAALGWALIGFGGSFAAAGAFVFRMFFIGARGGAPFYPFRLDHPVLPLIVPMMVGGLALLVWGFWLTRVARATGRPKPLVLSETETKKPGSPLSRG